VRIRENPSKLRSPLGKAKIRVVDLSMLGVVTRYVGRSYGDGRKEKRGSPPKVGGYRNIISSKENR